ncbi:hypothetical protein Tco_0351928 [Tanacetum coccineum]
MDDPNITMKEYIRLQEEKDLSHGETFDWQTAKYGKMEYCENKDDSFTNLKTEYPAIVFDDTSNVALLCEHAVSPLDNNEIDFNISFDESDDEDYMAMGQTDMAPLPHRDLRHLWLRYQVDGYDEGIVHSYEQRLKTIWGRAVNRVHVLDFAGLTDEMRQTLGDRLSMIYTRDDEQALFTSHAWRRLFEVRAPLLGEAWRRMTWRQFILALGLHIEEEMAEAGFGAYWSGSESVIPDKGDLRDYWMEISSDGDFLGDAPSYVFIRDPMRRLCHRMIACSISGRGQAPEKYLFRHAEGRKSRAWLLGSHFIGRLSAHFGLVGDQGLRGLSVVVSELPVIDLHELARLNICSRFGDTLAWVAPGPERQQAAVAGASRAAKDAPAADEGA